MAHWPRLDFFVFILFLFSTLSILLKPAPFFWGASAQFSAEGVIEMDLNGNLRLASPPNGTVFVNGMNFTDLQLNISASARLIHDLQVNVSSANADLSGAKGRLSSTESSLSSALDRIALLERALANLTTPQATPTATTTTASTTTASTTTASTTTASTTTTTTVSSASSIPVGTILYFATTVLPIGGYLKADGSNVSRTTYSALFAVIGTTFGAGNGVSTFSLPDLRGEFIRGFDNGRNVDSSRVFGSYQADAYPSHTHTFDKTYVEYSPSNPVYASASATRSIFSSKTSTSSAGSGAETRPRNVALLACIKF